MEKEFIPYEQSLALKELGFDRPCLGYFDPLYKQLVVWEKESTNSYSNWVSAPLYQQAFRWFREKYSYHHSIYYHKSSKFECRISDESDNNLSDKLFGNIYLTYEEAELECLKKLISIVKEK
jgi:hypothetical protein